MLTEIETRILELMLEDRWQNVGKKIKVDVAGTLIAQRLCTSKLMFDVCGHSQANAFSINIVNLKSVLGREPSQETVRTNSLESQSKRGDKYVGYSKAKQRQKPETSYKDLGSMVKNFAAKLG